MIICTHALDVLVNKNASGILVKFAFFDLVREKCMRIFFGGYVCVSFILDVTLCACVGLRIFSSPGNQ